MSEIKVFAKDYPMAPIDKFIPYANNARTHSKEQINKLRSIYRGIGYGDPVEVDENFTILSGHGRVEAAKAEGMTKRLVASFAFLKGLTKFIALASASVPLSEVATHSRKSRVA